MTIKHDILAKMYRRNGNPEDPWIGLRDHADPAGPLMMSEEINDNTNKTKTDIPELSAGMIVYYIWFLKARFL